MVASFTISLSVFAAALNTATGLFESTAGDVLLAGALASCAVPFLLDGSLARSFTPVLAGFALLFAVYLLSTLGNPAPRAAIHTGVILLVAVQVALTYQYGEHLSRSTGFALLLVGAAAVLAVRVAFFPYDRLGYEAGDSTFFWRIYQYSTALTQVLLLLACLAIRRRAAPVWLALGAAALGAFLVSSAAASRVQIALSLGLIPTFLWFYLTRRSRLWSAVTPLLALLGFAVYAIVSFSLLAEFVVGLVGSGEFALGLSADSPREVFWPIVVDLILARPVFGYGAGTILRDVSVITFSTHSQFLQIALQTGVVGVAAFVVLLVALWILLHRQEDGAVRAFGLAVMVSVIITNVFGLTLLQNAVSIGVLQWTILGLCMSPQPGRPAPGAHAAGGGTKSGTPASAALQPRLTLSAIDKK